MLVALEGIGEAPDVLPRCTGSRDVRGMKIGVWNVIHGKCEEMPDVKEHAPPLAGTSVETGVKVHDTGDVDDRRPVAGAVALRCPAQRMSISFLIRADSLEQFGHTQTFSAVAVVHAG